jgi:hypothetical protein
VKVLFFLVTFLLTQVTFFFGEEFLLAILITIIVLLFVELIVDWFVYSNQSKQIALIKQLTKRQIINGMLVDEIKKEYQEIENLLRMSEKLIVDCMLRMSEKLIELYRHKVELECVEYLIDILDENVELIKATEFAIQKQFVEELFEEL